MASRDLVLYHHPDCQAAAGVGVRGGMLSRWVRFWVTPTVAVWLVIGLAVAGLMAFPGAAKALQAFAAQPDTAKQAKAGPGKPKPAVRPVAKAGWSATATASIPDAYLDHYTAAAKTCPKLTPWLLAGIGQVESGHGQSRAPGVRSGVNRYGCCAGPMQFNLTNGPPSTWQTWGRPGGNVYDPADAIPAAARKLCHNGLGPGGFAAQWQGRRGADPCPKVLGSAAAHRALRRYNNVCWYADQVIRHARRFAPEGTRRVA